MAIEIKVPQFPESVEEGSIATWHKQVGEAVSRDELIVDIETDKTYIMGLYICLGQNIHNANINDAVMFKDLKSFKEIHNILETNSKLLVFITKAEHKIKKKAEQLACENAIKLIEQYNNKI